MICTISIRVYNIQSLSGCVESILFAVKGIHFHESVEAAFLFGIHVQMKINWLHEVFV